LGVLLFEMRDGETPFVGKDLVGTLRNIRKKPLQFSGGFSPVMEDLVRRLLSRLPNHRIGAEKIRDHPFFHGFDWAALRSGQMKPPFVPTLTSEVDMRHFRVSTASQQSTPRPVSSAEWAKDF